jgi:hypothetical protein
LKTKNGVSNHSTIVEISRRNIVGKNKSLSPDRYNKRLQYHATSAGDIDASRLIRDDILVAKVPVGNYVCTVAFQGVIKTLLDVLKSQPKPNVNLQSVIRALNRAIDDTDILVDCTCADFRYRFAYVATKYGYKFGQPETRPSKKTNPNDKLGATCKHLSALLSNKRWLVKLASVVNEIIKKYQYNIMDKYDLSPDEFIINVPGRPSSKTMRNRRMVNNQDTNNNNNEEELEPMTPTDETPEEES